MSEQELYVTRDRGIATLWLNRPAKRNAVTNDMWRGIGDLVHALAGDADVRALVLRGVGEHFCAGADIGGLAEMPLSEYHLANRHADEALATFPKPTVAVITGSCIGGGAELASCCDLRIAATGSVFGITPGRLGIVYPAYALERVVALIGPSAAKHLLYTAEIIDAERALRIGLIDELHSRETLEDRVARLLDTLRQRSLLTQVGSKAMIDAVLERGHIPDEVTRQWVGAVESAPDLPEGIAAFAEKRSPSFSWRPSLGG